MLMRSHINYAANIQQVVDLSSPTHLRSLYLVYRINSLQFHHRLKLMIHPIHLKKQPVGGMPFLTTLIRLVVPLLHAHYSNIQMVGAPRHPQKLHIVPTLPQLAPLPGKFKQIGQLDQVMGLLIYAIAVSPLLEFLAHGQYLCNHMFVIMLLLLLLLH